MTGAPAPKHYAPRWNNDTRPTPPSVGGERETLSAVLDWHRATFELKCAGLPPERLSDRQADRRQAGDHPAYRARTRPAHPRQTRLHLPHQIASWALQYRTEQQWLSRRRLRLPPAHPPRQAGDDGETGTEAGSSPLLAHQPSRRFLMSGRHQPVRAAGGEACDVPSRTSSRSARLQSVSAAGASAPGSYGF